MVRRTQFFLAFSRPFHSWLYPPSAAGRATGSYDGFLSLCEQVGVTRIVLLRHGKTSPAPEGGVDFDRMLADEGREQAKEAGSAFGRDFRPFYPSLLVSPAPRTMETAKLFLLAAGEKCKLEPIQNLYDGTMQPGGNQLFRKIGYAPLSDYLNCEDVEDQKQARTLLGAYAGTVVEAMANVMQVNKDNNNNNNGGDATLWMVGHAIYLPAAALGIASIAKCGESGVDLILSTNTKEAEGYLINVQECTAEYLSRPSSSIVQ